ncbi:hypothetical protein LX64_02449 [Chitinophaga skermanii]|uniref:Uncharacterized protein n=1 Tax=Chitinophaga skermanii TaxID=331697 RepID=A0A327QNR0_9BACT|nr:hypothetical protein [Chitinophaga skermanii]RAJ05292.1 hypothetical protein LX64_02449 [Chitinophaga skermanii]
MKQLRYLAIIALLQACNGTQPTNTADSTVVTADSSTQVQPAATAQSDLDTLHVNGKVWYISPATESEFKGADSIAVDTSEIRMFAKVGHDISYRHGDTLFVKAENGKIATFVNNKSDNDDYAHYQLQGILKEANQVYVLGSFYEWSDGYLVDLKTGKKQEIYYNPNVSPNKQFIITSSYDLVAAFVDNGFMFLERKGNGEYTKVDHKILKDWGTDEFRWLDDATLVAERKRVNEANGYEETIDYIKISIKDK